VTCDDGGDHQRRDLSADAPQVKKTEPLHDKPFAEGGAVSTVGVNT
jgi:hypothetical protein